MKKLLVNILIMLLVVCCKQSPKSDIGVLWQIENHNGVVSYIFGTAHLYPSSEMELSSKLIAKLHNCNVLALERDYTDSIENKKFEDYDNPNLDFFEESFKVIINEYGDELKFMEGELIKESQKFNIKVVGLESFEEVKEMLGKVSDLELDDKVYTISDYQNSLPLYLEGSVHDIKDSTTIQLGLKASKLLVDKRNENWIDDIEALISKDKTFIAVGVSHLGGEKGILNLLVLKGYALKKMN